MKLSSENKGQNNLLKVEKLLELGLLLPALTIISIASVYYFELGFFDYYQIPYELIQVELTRNIFLIFAFISVAFLILFVLHPVIDVWMSTKEKKLRIVHFIPFFGFFTLLAFSFGSLIPSPFHLETFFLIIPFLTGIFLLSFKKSVTLTKYIESSLFIKKIASLNFLGLFLVTCTSVCIVMQCAGYLKAKLYSRPTDLRNHALLLKNYSDYKIYLLRKGGDTISYFVVSKSSVDNDTLKILKPD